MAEGILRDRVAIVTGAGSPAGMGHAMALGLVRAGARVALFDLHPDGLAASVAALAAVGGEGCALGLVTDVTDPEAVQRSVDRTVDELGGLHILVNNAGTNPRSAGFEIASRRFWDIPLPAWDRVVAVNCTGPFYTARTVIGHLRKQGWGRIVGVTTSVDTMFGKNRVPYGPSKAAHEALVASMAEDLADSGVTANVLVPGGPTNTNFFSKKSAAERAVLIEPAVMQAPLVWLASDAAQDFTGRRIIACRWNEALPIEARLAAASAPAAWPQLGKQAVRPSAESAGPRA
ncbi:MAG TPA: SDR family oxidoreductase [Myxococcota bacterium]|jgi:NAD(P)-dependent dehydrogenase (short-subunit alcohol dehydrogenase family)